MIPGSRAADFSPEIRALSPDFMDWPFIKANLENLPDRFKKPVTARYGNKYRNEGQQAANLYLLGKQAVTKQALSLAASDAEICNYAAERAAFIRNKLAEVTGIKSADSMRGWLLDYAGQYGAVLPVSVTLHGIVGRMTDNAWWRRQIRRSIAREVEANAIDLGLVHRRACLYASDETCERHRGQQERNRKALENTEATNEEGYTATLAELSAVGVSNPKIRRMELMTRISGFEGYAKAAGHVGMFYTVTTPSRMHSRLSVSGQENPKFDGTTPKQAAAYLSKTWSKARAWLHRRGVSIYGFRVAEPHHDGTPHWHMLFFMLPYVADTVTACIRKYFSEADAHELQSAAAQKARFEVVAIDWKRGSAAGYISKYIAKNIDGQRPDESAAGDDYEAAEPTSAKDTAPRVLAWASTWGIRQFQQIGGPGVTVYRELRRIRGMKQGDLFDTWSAADAGNWQEFTERQGGATCRRAMRPVQLWAEQLPGKKNRYGEEAGKEVCGVDMAGVKYETRRHVWTIRKGGNVSINAMEAGRQRTAKAQASQGTEPGRVAGLGFSVLTLGASRPWSPVNNCTGEATKKDSDGFAIGFFADQEEPPPLSESAKAEIRRAQSAAVMGLIQSKRRRGAFGAFPRLEG